MNNLKLLWEVSTELQLRVGKGAEFIRSCAVDMERNRIFFASSANIIYSTEIPSPKDVGQMEKTPSVSEELLDLDDRDFVTGLEYLYEKESLIIGTSKGVLLLVSFDDNSTETVGHVEGGVCCISPSPDGGLLAITTGLGLILVMSLDWDLLYEIPLNDVPDDPDVHDSSHLADHSFGDLIAWRGDGKYFTSLARMRHSVELPKKLKVWERDSGALHSVSESKPFIGSALDWESNGSKIAVAYDKKDGKGGLFIGFFEKNGLERSVFKVSEGLDVTIECLKFSCNSDLLAALVRGETFDSLIVWHFSNYHWFLKQEIKYLKEDRVQFIWDPEKPLNLICWTIHGRIFTYRFFWITAVMDNSIAFVVDGSKIRVTPFSMSLIPPPMYFFTLEFSAAVLDMAFSSEISQKLAVSLADGSLSFMELPPLDQWDQFEGRSFEVEASFQHTAYGILQHLMWLGPHAVLGVTYTSHAKSYTNMSILEMEVKCSEGPVLCPLTATGWHIKILDQIHVGDIVVGMKPDPLTQYSALIQFNSGKVSEYLSKLGKNRVTALQGRPDISLASLCPWMTAVRILGSTNDKALLVGLDGHGRLHLGRQILCNNCRSFAFYSNSGDAMTHLVLATQQDLMFIVDVNEILLGKLEDKYENFHPVIVKNKKGRDESSFSYIWEKGAEIVGVLHGDESAVILQAPRGNIECVYPRKLVISSIMNALSQERLRDAFLMVRRHRIDFNFITDHCGWQTFVDLADTFVRQINNLSHITEFVCAIKEENVMETLYRNYVPMPSTGSNIVSSCEELNRVNAGGKINGVLMAIRKSLVKQIEETPSRELCILTTLAKCSPPDLEESLRRVKFIREMELSTPADPRQSSYPSSEEALKHLLWLSDPVAVFDAALGLYDLNLAAIVALNSQKDPKEFLPLLQELDQMSVPLMQYNVDLKLQRYESALRNIASAGDAYYEDFLDLMKKVPELYPLGLNLIADPHKKQQVLEAFGDHLVATKCFEDAATLYLQCCHLDKALKAYRSSGNWMKALVVASLMKFGEDEILQLARELAEELQALGKPEDAAKILTEYCSDIDSGVRLMIDARKWEEALRIAFLHRRDNLVSLVKKSAVECAETLSQEYSEEADKVAKYLTRYLGVRQRRLLLAAKIKSNEQPDGYLDDETSSLASSDVSGMSAYTKGTMRGTNSSASINTHTKGRNRQRNKGKIRARSPDEETALVEHLRGMSLSEGAKDELKSLISTLIIIEEQGAARKLQRCCEKFQISQIAAVKLADDAMTSDTIDDAALDLDRYIAAYQKETANSDAFSWQCKLLL